MGWRHRRRKRRRPLTGRKKKCPVCKVAKYPADWAKGDWIDGENFVSSQCKDCMAGARRALVSLTPDLQVTTRVKKKLRLQALNEVAGSVREYLIVPAWLSVGVVIWITWSLLTWLGLKELHALWRIGICGIVAGFYIHFVVKFRDWCEKPRGEWQQARLVELATIRQQQIEEAEQFYASAKWRAMRTLVISEEGAHCYLCNQDIEDPNEIAVDHVKPRSSHPELALIRENLRVACRSCNSSKGARQTT